MDPKEEVSNNPPTAEDTAITPQFVPTDTGESELRRIPAMSGAQMPWWTWMVPGARRAYQMRNLQAGTAEVMQLVRSIHQNLEHQVETQRLLVSSLSALPEAVEGLRNIGRATEAQREMMGALQRQMTANAGTMDRFNETLLSMDGTTKSVAERAKSSEAALFDLLKRAQRRMTLLTVLLVVTIAGVAGLAGFLLTGGKLPDLRLRDTAPAVVTPVPSAATLIPDTPKPESVASETLQPETSTPEAPAPEVPAVETPAPEAPTPKAAAPETSQSEVATPVSEEPVEAEAAALNPEPTPDLEPPQPTEASLRLEKLLKQLRERGSGVPPEVPQSDPFKP